MFCGSWVPKGCIPSSDVSPIAPVPSSLKKESKVLVVNGIIMVSRAHNMCKPELDPIDCKFIFSYFFYDTGHMGYHHTILRYAIETKQIWVKMSSSISFPPSVLLQSLKLEIVHFSADWCCQYYFVSGEIFTTRAGHTPSLSNLPRGEVTNNYKSGYEQSVINFFPSNIQLQRINTSISFLESSLPQAVPVYSWVLWNLLLNGLNSDCFVDYCPVKYYDEENKH